MFLFILFCILLHSPPPPSSFFNTPFRIIESGLVNKKKFTFGSRIKKLPHGRLLLNDDTDNNGQSKTSDSQQQRVLKLEEEVALVSKHFKLLQCTTVDDIRRLPQWAEEWTKQVGKALSASRLEANFLREKLSTEISNRVKLLHEVQDLRGSVRVYCLPKETNLQNERSIVSVPTNEICLLHRERVIGTDSMNSTMSPMSFEFDRTFDPKCSQEEVFSEMKNSLLGALDGYNICLMAYGQRKSGKTHSLIGDFSIEMGNVNDNILPRVHVVSHGLHLNAAKHMFKISNHRQMQSRDTFKITIVEVHHEKLCDMLAGTRIAEERGEMQRTQGKSKESVNTKNMIQVNMKRDRSPKKGDSSSKGTKSTKLEICTDNDGDTVVQGLISIPVESFDHVLRVWKESLAVRALRIEENGGDLGTYESSSHMIVTFHVSSTNISTGACSMGRIQFVDLAGSDAVPRRSNSKSKRTPVDDMLAPVGNSHEWKLVDKSLSTLANVVRERSQYARDVPYGNSTITHLLRDSLEGDTKVLLLLCLSSSEKNLQVSLSEDICPFK